MSSSASGDAFAQAPFAMAVVEAHEPFRLVTANAAFGEHIRQAPAAVRGAAMESALRAANLSAGSLEACRGVASDRMPRSGVESQGVPRRWWEITVSHIEHDGIPALLYVARDVSEREQQRRRLQESRIRLATLTAFARASLVPDLAHLLDAAAEAAATVSRGTAVIYLGDSPIFLRRAASCAAGGGRPDGLPAMLSETRYGSLCAVLERGGTTRVMSYTMTTPPDARDLLRELGMSWVAAVPIRGPRDTVGLVVAMARDSPGGMPPEQLQVLEACAGQLGLAVEHARLFREIETERAGLALVLEQIPDAVLITDRDGRVANANPAAGRLLGVAAGTVLSANGGEPRSTPESEVADPGAAVGTVGDLGIGRALAGETARGTLGLVRGTTAEPTWIISSAAPLRTPDTGAITGAVAVATDITSHRRAEDALRLLAETSAALAGSLDYRGTMPAVARLLVPRLADVCAIDVMDGEAPARIAYACVDTTAPHLAQALGRTAIPPGIAAEGHSRVARDVRDSDLRSLADDAEALGLLRSLGIRSSMCIPIGARGSVYGTLWLASTVSGRRYGTEARVLAEDIARRIGMAIDNARLFQEAQEADQRKDEFLAMLSHELRTPLAPVMAWMQILKRAPDRERVQMAIEVIERNVRLQATLIDDLLDLTAITRGKVTLDRALHDLRGIVETAIETVRSKVTDKGIVLACEMPDEPVMVEGDANRLQQVVWNLLANAVKFSPERERIRLAVARDGDTATLRVRDRGAGIAPEFLPHIFEMFQQQERGDRRRYGGLGIGLAIARRVTELHRGTIEVTSEGVGQGAEFCVRLPVVAARAAERWSEAPAISIEGRAVLLVEDVPDMREAAREMLEQMGVRVVDAAQGEEALAKLEATAIDFVLCDLRMPLMDGFELIRRIREDPRHRMLPVIAVSGYATQDDEERTRRAGFDGYVRKPFVESALIAAVERVLHERQRSASGDGRGRD